MWVCGGGGWGVGGMMDGAVVRGTRRPQLHMTTVAVAAATAVMWSPLTEASPCASSDRYDALLTTPPPNTSPITAAVQHPTATPTLALSPRPIPPHCHPQHPTLFFLRMRPVCTAVSALAALTGTVSGRST